MVELSDSRNQSDLEENEEAAEEKERYREEKEAARTRIASKTRHIHIRIYCTQKAETHRLVFHFNF